MRKTIALILILCLFIPVIVIADSGLYVYACNVGTNYITWCYANNGSYLSSTLNAEYIYNFDNTSGKFIAGNLKPNSTYIFSMVFGDVTLTNTTKTLFEDESNKEIFYNLIIPYLLFFLGLLCLIVGFYESIIAFGAFIFGIIGCLTSINNSFIMGTLFVLLIVASIFVAFRRI